jgi:hypothetical protein
MISTKNIVNDLNCIPREWVFEHYLNLKERLSGQNIKMLSVFNSSDKAPSMFIYYDAVAKYYKFKDFSSGYSGDQIRLVELMFNLSRSHAVVKVMRDYEDYVNLNGNVKLPEFKIHDKYKVTDFEMRSWNTLDEKYWSGYKIGSKILERYNVVPLKFFTMSKEDLDGSIASFTFNNPYTYGYFRNDGSLYKIYTPKNTEKKFIKVENYIQGLEQLTYDCKYLMITSSLKDLMSFVKLSISNIECIAPDSENTMITSAVLKDLKAKYTKIILLFDNDDPGINAAKKYKDLYGFNYVVLPLEKDLSDSIKIHGVDKVKEVLFPLLKQAL